MDLYCCNHVSRKEVQSRNILICKEEIIIKLSLLILLNDLGKIFVCRTWELMAPWTGEQIKVPVKFIVGDLDLTYNTPGVKEYIHNGGFKREVPYLQEMVVMEGVAHFINQERPEEISAHIYDFIKKF